MAKKKTSKKQKSFSFGDLPIVKLKKGVKAESYDATVSLSNKEAVARSIALCLVTGDLDSLKEILHGYVLAKNITHVAERAGLSVRTIHNALSKNGNPTISTILKLIS